MAGVALLRAGEAEAMRRALACARDAFDAGEVPVGAALLVDGVVALSASNRMRRDADPTAHAETLLLREAARTLGADVVRRATLVVTLEPCAMCAGAIVLARVARLVFGAWDDKAGMCGSVGDIVRHPRLNHRPEVLGGVDDGAAAEMLRAFFLQRRDGTASVEA